MQPKGRRSAVKRSQSVMGGGPSRSAKLGNANANKYTRNNDDEED